MAESQVLKSMYDSAEEAVPSVFGSDQTTQGVVSADGENEFFAVGTENSGEPVVYRVSVEESGDSYRVSYDEVDVDEARAENSEVESVLSQLGL